MKNLDYKWFIVIGLSIALAVSIIISLSSSNKGKDKYEAKIALYTDSIHRMQGRLDIYKIDQKELTDQLFVQYQEINNQRLIINKLKKKLNEKADSVYNLPNDKQLEFLSKWLSKRTN